MRPDFSPPSRLSAFVMLLAAVFPTGLLANEAPQHTSHFTPVGTVVIGFAEAPSQPTTFVTVTCDRRLAQGTTTIECLYEYGMVALASVAVASAELSLAVAIADGAPGDELLAVGALALATTRFAAAEAALIDCVTG